MKKFDERLADLSTKLDELSKKAEDASKKAADIREKGEAAIEEEISNIKGEVAAIEEQARINREEGMSKLGSELIKMQMTLEARVQDRKDRKDKAFLEMYMDDRAVAMLECLDMADIMIANALANYIELADAAVEYEARFGENKGE